MTSEIKRNEWREFFDKLSRDRIDFETTVEVLADRTGAQFLSKGLPLIGFTLDETGPVPRIDLTVGTGPETHQTHTFVDPIKVVFEPAGERDAGTLDIEDADGTKTLVSFKQALPTKVDFSEHEELAQVSGSGNAN